MSNLHLLMPEMLLGGLALLLMMSDLWLTGRHSRGFYAFGIVFAGVTLAALGVPYSDPAHYQGVGTMWVVDPMGLFFKILVLITTILVMLLSWEYVPQDRAHTGSFTSLILMTALGMMLLVSSVDLLLIFLSLELISISSFILAGFERHSMKSAEGAMKYFLIGALSAAVMLFGISLFYGATGTTLLVNLPANVSTRSLYWLGLMLILVGFGFKASIAPFHVWVPDAYEGAPTPVTTFLSIAPKIAALAAMMRVFGSLLPETDLKPLFALLAVLTMTVGNFTAFIQTNVKRLLAYSSIAQAGYMLVAFVAGEAMGRDSLLLYSLAYIFMNVGAFSIAIMLGNEESYELEAFDGLSERNLGLALLMTLFLLSLAGIPPLAGFVSKFYLFSAAIQAKYYWLVIAALLNSVASVYYYLRIAYHMFFVDARTKEPVKAGFFLYSGLTIAAIAIFVIGLYPDPFIASVRASRATLPAAAGSLQDGPR